MVVSCSYNWGGGKDLLQWICSIVRVVVIVTCWAHLETFLISRLHLRWPVPLSFSSEDKVG